MIVGMMDRERASRLMEEHRIDALLLFQPEHVFYATGVHPGVASLFRRAGAASVLVPADLRHDVCAVFPDLVADTVRRSFRGEAAFHPVWVGMGRSRPHSADERLSDVLQPADVLARPTTFDVRRSFSLVAEQMRGHGLSAARIGVDLGFVPVADLIVLRETIPDASILDGSDALRRLRMVKTTSEIDRLRRASSLAEAGFARAVASVSEGASREDLGRAYAAGVETAATKAGERFTGLWDYISIGPDPWGSNEPVAAGMIIKFDLGVVIDGYSSDFARTVCFGSPSQAARDLHGALLEGLQAGLAALAPGQELCNVYAAMNNAIRKRVPGYSRGHFGHGLGNDPFSEQWPFIASDSDVVAEPGMVLAVEAPYYVDGLGGFIIEDQVLVTSDGIEVITQSPRDLLQRGSHAQS